MSLQSNPKNYRNSSIMIRSEYGASYIWAVIEGEPMKVQLRLKPVDTGYQMMFKLAGTNIELPYKSNMVLCRVKEDTESVILEQNIMNMLEAE